jgi:transposase
MVYSQDLRNKVIEMYKNNQTRLAISQVFRIRYQTICEWISRYNETGSCDVKRDAKLGRCRNFEDKEAVLACIETNPDISGKEIKSKLAPNISRACFYNSLKRMGLSYKKKSLGTNKDARRKELSTRSWYLK